MLWASCFSPWHRIVTKKAPSNCRHPSCSRRCLIPTESGRKNHIAHSIRNNAIRQSAYSNRNADRNRLARNDRENGNFKLSVFAFQLSIRDRKVHLDDFPICPFLTKNKSCPRLDHYFFTRNFYGSDDVCSDPRNDASFILYSPTHP